MPLPRITEAHESDKNSSDAEAPSTPQVPPEDPETFLRELARDAGLAAQYLTAEPDSPGLTTRRMRKSQNPRARGSQSERSMLFSENVVVRAPQRASSLRNYSALYG
jgi:hypothetical protein